MSSRLNTIYTQEIIPRLKKELGRDNLNSLPKLQKVVVNMGVGKSIQDSKILDEAIEHLRQSHVHREQRHLPQAPDARGGAT